MLVGVFILALITPLSQFLTIKTANASIETDTPVGWALGVIISFLLAGLVLRLLAKRQILSRPNLALLYSMLALAVPLMNIGLVRQFFLASHAVIREYMYEGTSTYRTAYNVLNDRWFPVVPSREGFVWSRADRAVRLLEDPQARQQQAGARRDLAEFISRATDEGTDPEMLRDDVPFLLAILPQVPLDDLADALSFFESGHLARLGVFDQLRSQIDLKSARSAEAREMLSQTIRASDEWPLSLLPENQERAGYSGRERLLQETQRLPEAERQALRDRTAELEAIYGELRAAAMALGESDRGQLLSSLRESEAQSVKALSRSDFQTERNRYIFRLDRDERRSILRMDGTNGPNQNLFAFVMGLWNTPQEKARYESMAWPERFETVLISIPWAIYLRPLASWAVLFLAIFAFLMCLAEWLRRKWVSRENLPFPLVEVADYVIRHDSKLETAGDLTRPAVRKTLFAPLFLIGCGLGFVMLMAQGGSHYGFFGGTSVIAFNFSENIFDVAGGALKNLPVAVFVLSPIILGIVFLLSLEVSFSIWSSFILYSIVIFLVKAANPTLTDGNWTGWADGKLYPFTMEQMLGAVVAFSAFHLWKVRKQGHGGPQDSSQTYLAPRLTRWGLLLLPLLIYVLLWDAGLKNIPMLLMFTVAILVITVSIARVRAETGLPTGHAIYEFTKLPMIFGMTGMMGAKVYAAFLNLVFLPTTLLFRTLPQQLENMELARRYKINFRMVATSGFLSVAATLTIAFFSFLTFTYFMGQDFYGFSVLPPLKGGEASISVAHYPLWVGHFLGEPGLDRFTDVNWYRMIAIGGGFGVVGLLLFLRNRFMGFPLHPIGYLVLLMTILYSFETPYARNPEFRPLLTSTIWGSAFLAWLIKRLVVKYGGMNVYKQAKPLFVGLVVGSVAAIFLWNMIDLGFSLYATRDIVPGDLIRRFVETSPFTPIYF